MIYILVEGHGEIESVPKLAYKVCKDIGFNNIHFSKARRCTNVHRAETLVKEIKKIQRESNIEGLLIVRDEEDWCPKTHAPKMASVIRANTMPFPIAYHLMYREFETLFCAYLNEFSGKCIPRNTKGELIFKSDITAPENPESKRDAKGFLSDALISNSGYKPSIDQLALTQALDVKILRNLNVPCFGTFERCIKHLIENKGKFSVYPE
jgi:hypothetical protein